MSDLTDEELCARVAQFQKDHASSKCVFECIKLGSQMQELAPELSARLTAANSARAKLEEESAKLREALTAEQAWRDADEERLRIMATKLRTAALSPSPAPTEG